MKTLGVAIAAMLMIATTSRAALDRQMIGAEQDHSLAEAGDCEHFYKTTYTSFPAQVHDQEQREIVLSSGGRLRIVAGQEGGVSIHGWSKPFARLIICRYAVAHNRQQATRVLDAIQVSSDEIEIAAAGPPIDENRVWWVNMILYVPKRLTIDVRATGGGVAIRNMGGSVTAHATTGGISVAQSSGRYRISTETGGITLERISGDVEATSRGGAIALKLPAADLPTIEARTAEVGNILCMLDGCESQLGAWTPDHRTLRIGHGNPRIRLSSSGASILIGPAL
jgi:hypothetical protein